MMMMQHIYLTPLNIFRAFLLIAIPLNESLALNYYLIKSQAQILYCLFFASYRLFFFVLLYYVIISACHCLTISIARTRP